MSIQFKALGFEEHQLGRLVEVTVTGKLDKQDYEMFAPEMDRLIKEHGKLRILFVMRDFGGWTGGALWEDIKFDFKHFKDVERLALVGDRKWEHAMATFCVPFTTAKVKYFDLTHYEEAKEWIEAE